MSIGAQILSFVLITALFVAFGIFTASENYAEGSRIGFATKFSKKGRFWKSWEGELNVSQTGMNTSSLFDFSIDNDNESKELISMIDSAVNNGWKVKISYHQTFLKNWFKNRGETDYFITKVEVLDRKGLGNILQPQERQGRIVDTIYVVIDKNELKNK